MPKAEWWMFWRCVWRGIESKLKDEFEAKLGEAGGREPHEKSIWV